MAIEQKGNYVVGTGTVTGKEYKYEYVLPTMEVVNRRLEEFASKHSQIASGSIIGYSELGYPIKCLRIGNGPKELFVVGGTHSNEIIAVDVITQFLATFDKDFDQSLLNDITINIIPIQNPEGYKVLDVLMREINGYLARNDISLQEFCHEYYLKYRTDSLIYIAFREMNKFMTDENFITHYRDYIVNNEAYKRLHQNNALPKLNKKFPYLDNDGDTMMLTFDQRILSINPELPLDQYLNEVRNVIMDTRHKLSFTSDKLDKEFDIYLEMLFQALTVPLTLVNLNEIKKLHHDMLRDVSLNAYMILKNELSKEVEKKDSETLTVDFSKSLLMTCTKEQVQTIIAEFASNIINGVNLNGNTPYSPGIAVDRLGQIQYSKNTSIANLRNYTKDSPLGRSVSDAMADVPYIDESNMIFEKENQALIDFLNESKKNGTYGGCILCHGTGGELYYKPNEELTQNNFLNYSEYNERLVLAMQEAIDESIKDLDPDRAKQLEENEQHYYRKRDNDDNTGFGDFLRGKYPGVVMLENSVMGGNPFSPYGDISNYVRTVACFSKAIEGACKTLALTNKKNMGGHGSL